MERFIEDFCQSCEENFSSGLKRKFDKVSSMLKMPCKSMDEKKESRQKIFKFLYLFNYFFDNEDNYRDLINEAIKQKIDNPNNFVEFLRKSQINGKILLYKNTT